MFRIIRYNYIYCTKQKRLKVNAVTIESKNNCFPLSDQLQMLKSPFDGFQCVIISNGFIKFSLNHCRASESALGFDDVDFENEICDRILVMIDAFKINDSLKINLSNKIFF